MNCSMENSKIKTMKLEELSSLITELTSKLSTIPKKWDEKKTENGLCNGCYDDERIEKPVIKLNNKSLCKEHYSDYEVEKVREPIEKELKEIDDEIDFRKIYEKATTTKHFKDIMVLVRKSIIRERRRRRDSYSYDKKFTSDDIELAKKLARLLQKVKPESSKFIDRGIAINKDLFIAGTSIKERYRSPKTNIVLTALDQDEKYKSIARVELTLSEAERLRTTLTDCIEHVRIQKMLNDLEEEMKIVIEPTDESVFAFDEYDEE